MMHGWIPAERYLAYLTDRVLCAEKKKQLYGTQLETVNNELVPKAIEDEARLIELTKLAFTCPDLDSFRKQLSP